MVRCPFPYMSSNITHPETDGPGLCDQTIAENGGNTYKIFMAGWLIGILIIIILTIIQFIRLLRIRGYSLHLFVTSYLHHMYILSLYNLLTLLIRMTDPMNYSGRINYTFFKILKDTSSWATYSVVLLTVCSWVKIMYQITGRSRHTIILTERITVIITFFLFLFFGILQPQVEKGYIVFAVQMCLFVLYDVILITIAWTHGLRVYCHLVGYEQPTSTSASASHQSTPQATTSSLPPTTATTTTITNPSKPPRKQKESLQQKKSRVIILLKLICVLTICVCAAGSLQMYLGIEALKEKYHHIHNPEPYPTWSFGNLLNISGLSIVSSICSILVLIFARKFGTNSRDQSSTDINMKSNSDPRIPKSPIMDTNSRHLSQEREIKYWNMDLTREIEISKNKNIIKQPSTLMLSQIGRSSTSTAINNDVRVDVSTPTSTHPTITYATPIARTPVATVAMAEHPFQTATSSMDDITLEMEVTTTNHIAL